MTASHPIVPKCFFIAWMLGWCVAVYVPSSLIVLAGLSPLAGDRAFPAATFAVADEVAPFAKIGFAVVFACLLWVVRRAALNRAFALAADMLSGCAAMLGVLALLPLDWSRGFGIGLTGARFSLQTTPTYLGGAALAGLVFFFSERRCLARKSRNVSAAA